MALQTGGQDVFFGNIVKASRRIETDKIQPYSDPPGEVEICGTIKINGPGIYVDNIFPFTPLAVIQIHDDLKVNGTLQVDLIEACTLPGPVTINDTVETTGISFDTGTNVLSTYVDWSPVTIGGLFLNTVTSDAGSLFEQVGDKVTLNINIEFTHNLLLAIEFSGLFVVMGAPPAVGFPEIHSGTMLVSELPFPLTSRTCMLSMIPGTSVLFFRVEGGSLPAAVTHRILGKVIYHV